MLTVDLLEGEVGSSKEITDVLLVNDEGKIKVGNPTVKGAKVTVKIVEHGKDAKIKVFKYNSKSKYRKSHGHRQQITNLEVTKIA